MRGPRAVALALLIAPLAPISHDAAAADLGDRRSRIARPETAPAMPEVSPYSWSGLYFGAHGGYGWSDVNWQQEGGISARDNGEGWLAGGQIGVNLQSGRLVYGLEADISSGWIDGSNGDCCGHGVDWLTSVRGRAGVTSYDNRWLFYATAGAAWADFDYTSTGLGGHSETQLGWVAGGGIERALSAHLTARVEYLYYDFDSVSAPAGALGAGATALDPSMHTVRFGLGFKF
jgi:outer membrane immunogenic protein